MSARTERTPMVAIDRATEKRYRNFNRPGSQLWGVHSADGVWAFERIEDTGTPWVTIHRASGREVDYVGTLIRARANLYHALDVGRVCARCGGGHAVQVYPEVRTPCDCPS